MQGSIFILALTCSLSFAGLESDGDHLNEPLSSRNIGNPGAPCAGEMTRGSTADVRLAIALERSTDEIVQILTAKDQVSKNPEEWITVDLVQDHSHLERAPPIPGFVLTFIARRVFNRKIRGRIERQPADDFPKLTKMYILKTPEEFRAVTATLTAHTYVTLKPKDLPVVVDWFVETMYHPALGNKVFKISIVN